MYLYSHFNIVHIIMHIALNVHLMNFSKMQLDIQQYVFCDEILLSTLNFMNV